MKIPVIIEFYDIRKKPAPDGIELLFITKGENWHIGSWDSDHDQYTDQHCLDLYDIVYWAYIPGIPTQFPFKGFASDEAAMKLLKDKDG